MEPRYNWHPECKTMRKILVIYLTLAFISLLQDTHGALTHNGLPTGQTVAPTGRDYLIHATVRSPTPTRSRKARQGIRRKAYITPATNHPFLTLRDAACVNATPLAVRDDAGWVGIVRSVSSKQLSAMITRSAQRGTGARELTIILFHGGVECEWSRQFWRVWADFSRRMRRVCVVAIDGANDSMMNYNLMVLGFPTVMRVTGERNSDTFRGNRTVDELVEWAVGVGAGPPLEMDGWDGINGDLRWLQIEDRDMGVQVAVLDVGENAAKQSRRVNWALLGANLISLTNAGYVLWRAGTAWMHGKGSGGGVEVGGHGEET